MTNKKNEDKEKVTKNFIFSTENNEENKLLLFFGGKFTLYALTVTILIGLAILIYTEISYIFTPLKTIISSLIVPIILAYVFFYILNPLVNLLNRKMPRIIATVLAITIAVVAIFLIIVGAIPIIVEQTKNLISTLPKYVDVLRGYLATNSENTYIKAINEYLSTNLNTSKLSSEAVTYFSNFASNIASTVSSAATLMMTAPFILFFLLKDATTFKEFLVSVTPSKLKKSFNETLDEIDTKVGAYIQGQMLVSLCIGIMLFIGYNIIGLHYAMSLATLASLLSIVPYLGPVLAIIPAMLVAASTSGVMVLKMLVVWGLVQFIEGNILSPNIMGKSLKMHPLTVICVLLIGANLFGIAGAILGIPGYSILKILVIRISRVIKRRYERIFKD